MPKSPTITHLNNEFVKPAPGAILGKKPGEETKAEVRGDDDSSMKPYQAAGSGGSSSQAGCDETVINRKLPSATSLSPEKMQPPIKSKYVIPTKHDILMGRGVSYVRHPGNTRLQILVEENRERYRTLSKHEKSEVVKMILRKLRKGGSRFLIRKDRHIGTLLNDKGWTIASKGEAYDKVCHTLRGKHGTRYKSATSATSPQPTATTTMAAGKLLFGRNAFDGSVVNTNFILSLCSNLMGLPQAQEQPPLPPPPPPKQPPTPVQHGTGQQPKLPPHFLAMLFNNPVSSRIFPTPSSLRAIDSRIDCRNGQPTNPPSQQQQQQQEQHHAANAQPDIASIRLLMNKQPTLQRRQESYSVCADGKADNNNSDNQRFTMEYISDDIAAALPPDTEPAILIALSRYLDPKKEKG